MTTSAKTPFILSDLPIPPGEILEDELEARGMSRQDLAARMAADPRAIDEIVNGEKAIDAETAVGLANALGIGDHYWTGMETDYAAARARNETIAATRPPAARVAAFR